MVAPDPTNTPPAKQIDDHVQSSTMGAVKPLVEHPGSGRLVPVSAATPDAEPKAERIQPPQKTGHDIGKQVENSSTTPAVAMVPDPLNPGGFIDRDALVEREAAQGPYARLPKTQSTVRSDGEVIATNAVQAAADDIRDAENELKAANSRLEQAKKRAAGLDKSGPTGDTPFPRASGVLPVQGVTGPKNAPLV